MSKWPNLAIKGNFLLNLHISRNRSCEVPKRTPCTGTCKLNNYTVIIANLMLQSKKIYTEVQLNIQLNKNLHFIEPLLIITDTATVQSDCKIILFQTDL